MRLCLTLVACLSATSADAVPTGRTLKMGGAVVKASPKAICVFEWAYGDQQGRYEGWDSCARMTIRTATPTYLRGVRAHGRDKSVTVADIPRGAPSFVVGNGVSEVLIFIDRNGEVREIMTAD